MDAPDTAFSLADCEQGRTGERTIHPAQTQQSIPSGTAFGGAMPESGSVSRGRGAHGRPPLALRAIHPSPSRALRAQRSNRPTAAGRGEESIARKAGQGSGRRVSLRSSLRSELRAIGALRPRGADTQSLRTRQIGRGAIAPPRPGAPLPRAADAPARRPLPYVPAVRRSLRQRPEPADPARVGDDLDHGRRRAGRSPCARGREFAEPSLCNPRAAHGACTVACDGSGMTFCAHLLLAPPATAGRSLPTPGAPAGPRRSVCPAGRTGGGATPSSDRKDRHVR